MSCIIIAEAGVNHNGDTIRALDMVDAAADAGADYVKFQTFKAENLVTRSAAMADYQKRNLGGGESQFAMLKGLELSLQAHHAVAQRCRERGIGFLSTPFDHQSLRFLLDEMKLGVLKLGSGDMNNAPLLLEIARSGVDLILSTGMAVADEIEQALDVLAFGHADAMSSPSRAMIAGCFRRYGVKSKVTLLHCTTEYPAAPRAIHLRAMETLRRRFGLPVGFSDHSEGNAIAMASIALGAVVVEKHFTLDRSLPGPDHKASVTPAELKALVAGIRDIEVALGQFEKPMEDAELSNRAVARKSLVTLAPVAKGQRFDTTNLGVKRPGTGIAPIEYWDYIGKPANRDYATDEILES